MIQFVYDFLLLLAIHELSELEVFFVRKTWHLDSKTIFLELSFPVWNLLSFYCTWFPDIHLNRTFTHGPSIVFIVYLHIFFGFGSIDKKTSGLLLINSGFCKTQPIYLAIQIFPFCSYLLNMFDRQNNYKQIWNWHTNTTWCEMFKMLLQ